MKHRRDSRLHVLKRPSVGVMLIIAATLLVAISLFPISPSAWGQVQRAISKIASVQFVLTEIVDGKQAEDTLVFLDQRGLKYRVKRTNGSYDVGDFASGRVVQFFPGEKRAVVNESIPIPEGFNIVERLQSVVATAEPVNDASLKRMIAGRPMEIFRFSDNTGEYHLWIDSETKLPARVKLLSRNSTDRTSRAVQEDYHDFKYDVPVSPDEISDQIPPDFMVETRKSVREPNSGDKFDNADIVAASQRSTAMKILPGLGVGELRLGMSPEQVRTELGLPDFFQDKLEHKLPDGTQSKQGAIMHFRKLGLALRFGFDDKLNNIHMFAKDSPTMLARESVKPVSDFGGKLDTGIGIGSSRAEVVQLLGKATSENEYMDGVKQVYYKEVSLSFFIANDRVCEIILGKKETSR